MRAMQKTVPADVIAHVVNVIPVDVVVRPPSVSWFTKNFSEYRTIEIPPGDNVSETLFVTAGCSARGNAEYTCLVTRSDAKTLRAIECVAARHLDVDEMGVGKVLNIGDALADGSPLSMVVIAADDVLRGEARQFRDRSGRDIHFHRIVPIYAAEADAVGRLGPGWFLDQCDDHGINSCDIDRPMIPLDNVES